MHLFTILAPAFVCILGVLLYALSTNGKNVEIGRIAFFVGLLWLVYVLSTHEIRF
jgi:hypothetical protein